MSGLTRQERSAEVKDQKRADDGRWVESGGSVKDSKGKEPSKPEHYASVEAQVAQDAHDWAKATGAPTDTPDARRWNDAHMVMHNSAQSVVSAVKATDMPISGKSLMRLHALQIAVMRSAKADTVAAARKAYIDSDMVNAMNDVADEADDVAETPVQKRTAKFIRQVAEHCAKAHNEYDMMFPD